MSADLHIHVVDPVTLEKDVQTSFRCTCSVLGPKGCQNVEEKFKYDGKWYTFNELFKLLKVAENIDKIKVQGRKKIVLKYDEDAINKTPSVWVGEVSWLKAGLFDDSKTFIPGPVQAVFDLIGDKLPTITDGFITAILEALDVPNTTSYSIAKKKDVKKFLEQYKGKKVFTISW